MPRVIVTDGIRDAQAARGGSFTDVAGRDVARHFDDPAAEYAAVRESAGVAVRADLAPIRMWGRDPARMLHGLVTNDVLSPPEGRGVYSAMLTPKGRMIAELRSFRRAAAEPELLVLLPREALAGTTEHLRKFVPPMFARWADMSEELGVVGVYGPRAHEIVSSVLQCDLPAEEAGFTETTHENVQVLTTATREAGNETGFDIIAPADALAALWNRLLESGARYGARPLGFATLETLRIEAGRPRYGAELTDATIPTEAYEPIGWMDRAISFSKGCYTGQEVIVRIAHRGHVNRLLRGLLLGDSPSPPSRAPLVNPENGKEVGWISSTAVSPLMKQTVALGFVRREFSGGDTLRVGTVDGPPAIVTELPFTS